MPAFLFSFFATFLLINVSFAATKATPNGAEVDLFTPWSFINTSVSTSLSSAPLKIQSDIPQIDLTVDPLTWHLSGLHWQVNADLNPGKWDSQSLDVSAKTIQFSVTIQKLMVDQYIDKTINGGVLHVHVQASCGPATLTQNNATAAAHLLYQVSSQKIATQVGSFSLQWPNSSWQISDFTCAGPVGFDKTLKTALVQQLQTADVFRPWAQNLISQKLQDAVNAEIAQLALPEPLPASQIPTPLTMSLKSLQSLPEGVIATGVLSWAGKNEDADILPLDMKELPVALTKSKTPQLITRTVAMSDLIEAQLRALKSPKKIDLKQFPFFVKLLKSRFTQTFVWPDLWNYSEDSSFSLQVPMPRNLNLKWLHDGSATFQLASSAELVSVREDRAWNYLDLQGQALGRLTPTISGGLLKVDIALSSSKFAAQMNSTYQNHFHPNTYLGQSLITNLQTAMNQSFNYQVEIPSLDLGPLGIARADGWQIQPDDLLSIPVSVKAK